MDLYKFKILKGVSFTFIHYWLILKDVLLWVDAHNEMKKLVQQMQNL
jgi:hypothetical protein